MSLNSINVNNSSIIGIDNEIKCTDNLVKNEAIYREIISPEIFLDLRFYQFDVNDTTEWLGPDLGRLSYVATYVNATIDNPVTMTWNENVKLWFFDGDDPHHLPHTSTEYQDPSKNYVVSPLTLTHSKYIAGTFFDYSVPKDIDYFNVKVKYDNQLSIK